MVEDITRSKWVECLAIVGGLLLPGIMTIGVANSANDGEVFGRNWTSEPIADIQPDITSGFRQAGDAELLFSSRRHAPFQQPLAERPVHAVQQVLGDEPQFGVTLDAQLAVEEQGVGVFLAHHHAQEVDAVGGQSQVGRTFVVLVQKLLVVGAKAHLDAGFHHWIIAPAARRAGRGKLLQERVFMPFPGAVL